MGEIKEVDADHSYSFSRLSIFFFEKKLVGTKLIIKNIVGTKLIIKLDQII